MATNTGTYTDKAQDAMNGARRAASSAQDALSNIDMDSVNSQIKEVVRMGEQFRRERPILFWGAVCGVTALLAFVLFRPSKT